MQRIAKSVTRFAYANPAPLFATADVRRYVQENKFAIPLVINYDN